MPSLYEDAAERLGFDHPAECRFNATRLAGAFPQLRIVRGAARLSGEWLAHWFCVDIVGNVVDTTWQNRGREYRGELIDLLELEHTDLHALVEPIAWQGWKVPGRTSDPLWHDPSNGRSPAPGP